MARKEKSDFHDKKSSTYEVDVQISHVFTPKYGVSSFRVYLKGKSAVMIFDRHANLKYKYGNRHFWARGYYVSTEGLNEATIVKYERARETRPNDGS